MTDNNRIKNLEQEVKSLRDTVNFLSEKFWELHTDYHDGFENDKVEREESYKKFINDVLYHDKSSSITDNELFDKYKKYYNDNYPIKLIDGKNIILSKLHDILGSENRINNVFQNWNFKEYKNIEDESLL